MPKVLVRARQHGAQRSTSVASAEPGEEGHRTHDRDRAEAGRRGPVGVRGLTSQEIADTLGFADRARESRAIRTALQRTETEAVDEWRHILDTQLDASVKVTFDVLNGVPSAQIVIPEGMDEKEGQDWLDRITARLADDHESRLKAVDRLVRIVERRAKLHGVDAPVVTELSGGDGITVMFSPGLNPGAARSGGS